jgi:uncharacterized protein DUF2330
MRARWLAPALTSLLFARPADACAPAPPPGVQVHIAEEEALIVWDAAAHREDFIRRASFRTTGREFGFLVPTPTRPDLAEAPADLFDHFESATRPEIEVTHPVEGVEPTLLCGFMFFLQRASSAPPAAAVAPVRVLDAQRVAGYDAVILEADSAGALADWLKEHGYADRPALATWLAPYVEQRWKLTAFKIAHDGDRPAVTTAAVRMSFTTDRPFFPYREPADQRENVPPAESERLLRVFFLGAERMEGTLGETRSAWPGKAIWAGRFDPDHVAGDGLPPTLPPRPWLTMFEDRASPRPGTDDLFFTPAPDKAPLKPSPIVWVQGTKIPLPLDLLALLGFVGWRIARRRAKARREARPPIA